MDNGRSLAFVGFIKIFWLLYIDALPADLHSPRLGPVRLARLAGPQAHRGSFGVPSQLGPGPAVRGWILSELATLGGHGRAA
jgi:hypothetical protein